MVSVEFSRQLSNLAEEMKGEKFPQVVLRESIFELVYILERIEHLRTKANLISLNRHESEKFLRSMRLIHFYSQCLVLWSYRILEILKETSDFIIPPNLRIARNILVAHYGIAKGNLREKLSRNQGFISSPKISPNGNLTYMIGPLESPASIASPSELQTIKQLFRKYCPGEPEPNIWEVCNKIFCNADIKIIDEDLAKIELFIRNNGGIITDSDRIIGCVIKLLEKYVKIG